MANTLEDYTESNIISRDKKIIESFLNFVVANGLIANLSSNNWCSFPLKIFNKTLIKKSTLNKEYNFKIVPFNWLRIVKIAPFN